MKIHCILCSLVFGLSFSESSFAVEEAREKFDSVTIKDGYGKSRTLGEFKESKFLVVAFLGTECPLAKLYGPRLQQLSEKFESTSVGFVGVCANLQDSLTEITAYTNKAGISFPMLIRAEAVRLIVVTAIWIEGPRSIGVQSLIGHMIPIGILRVIVNWTTIVIKCPMTMRAEALVTVKRARHCDRVICLTEIAGLAAAVVVVVEVVKE